MISRTSEYALRAALHLARMEDGEELVRVQEMAEALEVPRNYLSKILHTLGRTGVVTSTRGPHGGFRLAESSETLTLARVVEPFDPQLLDEERRCLLGRRACRDDDPCPAHERWKDVARDIRSFFRDTTLAELERSAATVPGMS